MAIVDGTTTDGLIMKSLLTNRRNCPLEETFPSRLLIIEVMSSYHWPYLPKRLNVKLDFIQLRASLRKNCYRRTFGFQEASYHWFKFDSNQFRRAGNMWRIQRFLPDANCALLG